MFVWAGIFIVVAIVAGYFGFKKSSDPKTRICKILFFLCLVGFVITLAIGLVQKFLSPARMIKGATEQYSPFGS